MPAADFSYSELVERLARFGQQHLLARWDQLNDAQRQYLTQQLQAIDFEQLRRLADQAGATTDWGALAARAESPPGIRLEGPQSISATEADAAGGEALRQGKVGVLLVAGGQGSRLGFPHPKGMFTLGPVSGRTLFEMLVDTHHAVARKHQAKLPLFLMTSPATDEETRQYFDAHDRLGFSRDQLTIFCQGTMPAVDAESGRVLMQGRGEVSLSPDGHGGTLPALQRSGCLQQIVDRGIEYLFYFQVDNPLVKVADPVFLGYHILARSEMTTQVIRKQDPHEKVGNVVKVDGRMHVIEYSDLPAAAAERRLADGTLALWAGSIAVHAFDVQFLTRMANDASSLPFHQAKKKVAHLDAAGNWVEPEQPNAIKYERFIFDLLPSAKNAIVVEVDEARSFAPLKNAPGAPKDTPEYVQSALLAEHRRWLAKAGIELPAGARVEISPHFALDADELAAKASQIGPIEGEMFLR